MMRAPRRAAAAGLAYLALAVLWAAPSSLSPATLIPDVGDPLHLSWVMSWDAHQLVRHPLELFEANTFYPYHRSLAFGDHLLPEALMVAPVFYLSGNAVLASNIAVLLALFLSAFSMYLLIEETTGAAGAAFLAGLAYAFNSFTRSELLRVQVLNIEWWPLAFLFLVRFVREGRRRDCWALGLVLLLQGLSGTYYLIYSALLAPLWIGVVYWAFGRLPRAREIRLLALAGLAAALFALPILLQYAIQLRTMGFEKPLREGVDVLSYVNPGATSLLSRLRLLPGETGVPHFLGLLGSVLLACGILSLVRGAKDAERRSLGLLALTTCGVGFLLSLGPDIIVHGRRLGPGPYALLYKFVPLTRGMSSPNRAAVLVLLGGAVLLGLGVEWALRALPRSAGLTALVLLAGLLPLEHWSPATTGMRVPTGKEVPEAYRFLAGGDGSPMIDLPLYPDVAKRYWALYLYFSTYHWRPIPIGRTSFYPPSHDYLAWSLRGFPDDLSIGILAHLGIRTLVVHPLVWEDPAERERNLAALDADSRLTLVKAFEDAPPGVPGLELGHERIYRIVGAEEKAETPLCTPEDELRRVGWILSGTGINQPRRAVDGDRRTAWSTAAPQKPGDRLEVRFPEAQDVSALAIDLWYPHAEFPRNLVVFLEGEEGGFERVPYLDGPQVRSATIDALVSRPREARMVLRLKKARARAFRLMVGLRERDGAWAAFSVPELHAYAECR